MNQLARNRRMALVSAMPQRDPQRDDHQVGALGRGAVRGHDPIGLDVENEGHADKPDSRVDIGDAPTCDLGLMGEVGDPDQIGCGEVAVEQVTGPDPSLAGIVVRVPLSRRRPTPAAVR